MAAASTAAAKLPGAVTYIPADRLPAVREAFRSFDTAGSGEIALSELAGVLRSLRYTVSRTELELLAERFGGPTTRLRYETVLEIVGQVHNRKRGLSALLAAFREFDRDGSGTITVATFRSILTSLGESKAEAGGVAFVPGDVAEEMVASADPDDTGLVEYEVWARSLVAQADALKRQGRTPAQARKLLREAAEEKAKGKGGKKK